MATTPSIRVVKSFLFKGGTRLWSNRYHMNGGVPSSDTQWHTLMDNVVAAEKLCLQSGVTIVECFGYAAGSDVPVASKTYSQAGSLSSGANHQAGEVAAILRWSTDARTSKNHPVYLFNYFHGVYEQTGGTNVDKLDGTQKTAIDTYAGSWISGFSDGTHTLVRAGPRGASALGHQTETYLTHRDFPYTRSA